MSKLVRLSSGGWVRADRVMSVAASARDDKVAVIVSFGHGGMLSWTYDTMNDAMTIADKMADVVNAALADDAP